ncbi:ketopantoate reductase family protein [Halobium salinum]|uniref:2-dehydropantoate 2-reductase n=1 Tax=Halobium salinum TaxID=1364940 RepID=A0ABD5PG17_9EURY|nr:2-dehydropantoate 2-reductase [Halobium salinum]
MDIVVFGAGSLGSLLGGLLARAHDVTLVGRDPHVSTVRKDGLRIEGEVEADVDPDADTTAPESADLVLVTVKSYDTAAAVEALADGDYGAVCSLQNGLTEERLAELDAPVVAGTASYGARLRESGLVDCTGVGRVVVGGLDRGPDPVAERVGRAFRAADVRTLVASDMPRRRWEKLAVNAGINATTALCRVENGALVGGDPPGKGENAPRLAREAAHETARVARAEGVPLSNRQARAAVERVASATATNRSSMLQDVESRSRTEVDALNGAVVDRAERHDVGVPTNRTLTRLLRAWERGAGVR